MVLRVAAFLPRLKSWTSCREDREPPRAFRAGWFTILYAGSYSPAHKLNRYPRTRVHHGPPHRRAHIGKHPFEGAPAWRLKTAPAGSRAPWPAPLKKAPFQEGDCMPYVLAAALRVQMGSGEDFAGEVQIRRNYLCPPYRVTLNETICGHRRRACPAGRL